MDAECVFIVILASFSIEEDIGLILPGILPTSDSGWLWHLLVLGKFSDRNGGRAEKNRVQRDA